MESDTRIFNDAAMEERRKRPLWQFLSCNFGKGSLAILLLLPVTWTFMERQETFMMITFRGNFTALSNTTAAKRISDPHAFFDAANSNTSFQYPIPRSMWNFSSIALPQVPAGVVWLASFPNSGTSYTISVVHALTNATTATNYGGNERDDRNDSIAVYYDAIPQGPYYRYPGQLPYTNTNAHILTKTHCEQNVSGTLEQFIVSCASGTNYTRMAKVETTYPTQIVTGVVHLLRNPFDNIVARMNYQRSIWEKGKQADDLKKASFFQLSEKGFYWWCQYKDKKKSLAHDELMARDNGTFYEEYLQPVPCWIEFYLYFRWHELMVEMLSENSSTNAIFPPRPSMILYYEDYKDSQKAHAQMEKLLSFLHFAGADSSHFPKFESHLPYDFFTPDERAAVQRLARVMTSPATWSLLQHYFD
jgi:hypothetical protein